MRQRTIFNLLIVILIGIGIQHIPLQQAFAEKPPESIPFAVYTESTSRNNHFVPSGWMGDYDAISISQDCKDDPRSGATCIKIIYTAELTQGAGWVGVFWQNPENNWGTKGGGFNLSNAKRLSIWARGAKGGEKMEFKVGGITGAYPDSDMIGIGPLELTDEWAEYVVGLEGVDMSYVSGGFVWAASRMDNPDGAVIYMDDIIYE
ncbi:MAG: hypothetical protein HQ572_05015 [Candidatus Omnitrophica bacterium]|nr:hypothetical protein [Candidatus Omnitrophota bacterium]